MAAGGWLGLNKSEIQRMPGLYDFHEDSLWSDEEKQ